jgi:hypothetical protein
MAEAQVHVHRPAAKGLDEDPAPNFVWELLEKGIIRRRRSDALAELLLRRRWRQDMGALGGETGQQL